MTQIRVSQVKNLNNAGNTTNLSNNLNYMFSRNIILEQTISTVTNTLELDNVYAQDLKNILVFINGALQENNGTLYTISNDNFNDPQSKTKFTFNGDLQVGDVVKIINDQFKTVEV